MIDPKNVKLKAEFEEALNGGVKKVLRVIYDSMEYNFTQIRTELGSNKKGLENHLEEHKIKEERISAIRGFVIKGVALFAGAVGLLIGFVGLYR